MTKNPDKGPERRTRTVTKIRDFFFPLPEACANLFVCRRVDIGHQMPLRETEAIVLRTYRLGEAEKIASLFTRQIGPAAGCGAGRSAPQEPLRRARWSLSATCALRSSSAKIAIFCA